MKKTYTINVTAKDIKLGCQLNMKRCPVARAMTRALKTKIEGLWWIIGMEVRSL
jgi:metal-sulfur cluster biosynthetic enzyme